VNVSGDTLRSCHGQLKEAAGWLSGAPKFLSSMLEQKLPGFPMSTVPLWDLIHTHFSAVVGNESIYSCP